MFLNVINLCLLIDVTFPFDVNLSIQENKHKNAHFPQLFSVTAVMQGRFHKTI